MQLKPLGLSIMALGSAMSLVATQTYASGYQFGSQSVAGQGTAHANGAEANDPSTIFTNPAGLSRLDGLQISGGVTLVVPRSEYTDHGSTNLLGQSTGSGDGSKFAPSIVAAPNFYLSKKINDKINVGLGLFVPYGAQLDYGYDWAGRYALKSIKLTSFNLNPSMSFKLDERNSLGFGLSAQYMKADLKQMADATTGINYKLGTQGLNAAQIQAIGVSGDGLARIEGDDWGFGWNIGYLFELNENTRFGVAYRSKIKQALSGTSTWTFNNVKNNAVPGLGIGANTLGELAKARHPDADASVDVTTPATLSANFFHQLDPKWAIMGDITWVENSELQDIVIKQSTVGGVAQGDLTIHQNWRDTWRLAFGANYRHSDAWLFRGGLAWEQSPIRSAEDRHPSIPDSNRFWLSLGANYRIDKASSFDLAYSFLKFSNASVSYNDSCSPMGVKPSNGQACTGNGGTIRGSYKTQLHLIGVQYNHRF